MKNWTIEKVKAGSWRRGNEPEWLVFEDRVHVVPNSFEAFQFVVADTQPYPLDHLTFIGWNPSWVKVGEAWVRAYRPNSEDEGEARRMAKKMIEFLDRAMKNRQGKFLRIEYVGTEPLLSR